MRSVSSRPGKRLVQQDDLGLGRQHPRQRHPLLLAAGKHVRIGIRVSLHVDLEKHLVDARPAPGGRKAGESESHVVGDGQMRKQGIVLKHQSDAAGFRRHVPAGLPDGLPVQFDGAGLDAFQPGRQPEQRRLAAPRRPEQTDDLPRLHSAGHVIQDARPAEGVRKAGNLQGRRHVLASALVSM